MRPVANQFPSADPGTVRLALVGDTEELDYILGFLACDGSFDKNGSTIDLQLQKRDQKVIDLFCRVFETHMDKPRFLKGRTYIRARAHGKGRWGRVLELIGGRLKEARRWPANATDAFVAGCLDADGSFVIHHGLVEGSFQHASESFRNGLAQWLRTRGLNCRLRKDRPIVDIPAKTCRQLAARWPACGLTRKQAIAASVPVPNKRWWSPADTAIVMNLGLSLKTVAILTGKSLKAVQLKRWRALRATCS